jgi:hypothetical protein
MRLQRLAVLLCLLGGALTLTAADVSTPAFTFGQVGYFHRWSQANQHEFTPAKQEDLEHWTDMITINSYPGVDDAEKMAGTANAVLGNYRSHKGKILKTDSVPATDARPAEHLVAVLFGRPGFSEAAFARFKLVDGKGYSFVYSRRFYGDKAADEISEWLKTNGEKIESALMNWNPPASALSDR